MENRADETLLELQALVEGGLAPYHPSVKLVYLALWVRSRIIRGSLGRRAMEPAA